ncbi:MAG: hypothetical protein IPO23_01960 [Flavobacterium sp.]|nr:hypothetical protein [Flavobacterium sp.]
MDISYRTKIGKGIYVGHFGGVVVHGDVEIGDYCNLSQGITLGVSNYGKNRNTHYWSSCFLGPGSCVLVTLLSGIM